MATRTRQPPSSPLYYQLASRLRDRIDGGELAPHERAPSERRLSEEFGVSRMTARKALETLEREGYVYRDGRRGTFVAEPRMDLRIGSFSDEVGRRGARPGARVLRAEVQRPTRLVAEALGLEVGERVYYVQRLRLANEQPLAIENSYFSCNRFPDLLELPLSGRLWSVLRRSYNAVPERAEARVEAVVLDRFECRQLETPSGAAGILLTRLTFDGDGRPMEFARDVYRGDRAEFRVEAAIPPTASADPTLLLFPSPRRPYEESHPGAAAG